MKAAEAGAVPVEAPDDADTGGEVVTLVPGAVDVLPILPLRDTVIFPDTIMPLSIGRESSLQMLEQSLSQSKLLGLVLQKDKDNESPKLEDLHEHGVIGRVIRMIRQDSGVVILVRGEQRMRIKKVVQEAPYMKAEVETLPGAVFFTRASIAALMQSRPHSSP